MGDQLFVDSTLDENTVYTDEYCCVVLMVMC